MIFTRPYGGKFIELLPLFTNRDGDNSAGRPLILGKSIFLLIFYIQVVLSLSFKCHTDFSNSCLSCYVEVVW